MRKLFSILFLSLLAVGIANAQTADEIAKKYVDAIGGAAKWKAVKSSKQTINLNTQGFDIKGTVIGDDKNRSRAELALQGTKIIQAYDGTNAWWINPFQGVTTAAAMPAALSDAVKDQEFLNDFIDWKKRGTTITVEGEETVDDKACYKMKVVKKSGTETTYFISKENSLLVMTRTTDKTQGFAQTIESYFSDYKEVDGLLSAGKVVAKSGGVVQRTTTIESVEYNVAVSDDMFAMPGK